MTVLEKQLLEALKELRDAYQEFMGVPAVKANAAIAAAESAQPAPNYPAVPEGWLPQGDWQIPLAMSIAGHRRLKELTSIEPNLYEVDEVFRAMLAAAPPATVKDSLIVQQAPGVPDDARECLLDVVSHHHDFAEAVQRCADIERENGDDEDVGYWKHQADVLNRMKEQAERALAAAPATKGNYRD